MYHYHIAVIFPDCSVTVYLPVATHQPINAHEQEALGNAIAKGCGAEYLWAQEAEN